MRDEKETLNIPMVKKLINSFKKLGKKISNNHFYLLSHKNKKSSIYSVLCIR